MASPSDALAERFFPSRSQSVVATIVALGLLALAAWYLVAGTRLVDHDAAPRPSLEFTVDVNAAGEAELAQLPGVGPALARRIVERRTTAGRFARDEDLLAVPGIGTVTLERLRPHLRPLSQDDPFPPAEARR